MGVNNVYCIATLERSKMTTEIKSNSLSPVFNKPFNMYALHTQHTHSLHARERTRPAIRIRIASYNTHTPLTAGQAGDGCEQRAEHLGVEQERQTR